MLFIYSSILFINGNEASALDFVKESYEISPSPTSTATPALTSTLGPRSTLDSSPTISPASTESVKDELTSHFDVPETSLEHVEDLLLKLKELTHKKVFGNRVFSRDVSQSIFESFSSFVFPECLR